ncbi:Lrp/AsnC family transcriptional regulator [Sediminivirga luteola]|uniref:Lrp/AsnC family transcriptional regulator n=1 Tax=Sediminivirga luteola TaxID=1774748 RepID=UPI00166563F8|nr:Lrp/AsnC ligand binding domain-containing protein [Sediminivirga luteola]
MVKSTREILDPVDQQIVAALHGAGRDSWENVAARTSCSASTARRRFEALSDAGLVRVIGATDVSRLGIGTPVILRFRGVPGEVESFMAALGQRSDVRFLTAVAGSADCVAELVVPEMGDFVQLMTQLVDGTSITTESFVVTHTYRSGQDWLPWHDEAPDRAGQAGGQQDAAGRDLPSPVTISRVEAGVLSHLMTDGRIPVGVLAGAVGCSERAAAGAIESLRAKELLDFRVLVEPELLGYRAECFVWLDVVPGALQETAARLAAHPGTKYLSATTGRFGLVGQVALPGIADIHDYTTTVLGALPGVRSVDVTLQVATAKRVWTRVIDGAYAAPEGPIGVVAALGDGAARRDRER